MVNFYRIFVVCMLTGPLSFGQTLTDREYITRDYDLEKLSQLSAEFLQSEQTQRAQALEMASLKGWPEVIESQDGFYSVLVGIFENGEPKYRVTHNREGGITTRANTLHSGGSTGLELNGENMIVGEWDGGAVRLSHQLLTGRVVQIDGATGSGDHATHVAGTLIGNGDVVNGAAKGMLPDGTLWAHDWFSDYPEMIAAAADGLLVSNHSYGAGIQGSPLWYLGYYDNDARGLDNIQYNAPYYLAIVSAGNDRQSGVNSGDGGFDYLTDMATSKNNMTVAATFEVLNYTGPGSVGMSGFSSWGPTDDGRVKPDISGKGVNMYSSVGGSNSAYANYSGTSMSSPNVAGSLMLLQQHFNETTGDYMKASTLKGLAIHTADETGTAPGPDYRFGWGLLNVQRGAEVISGMNDSSYLIEETLESGETIVFSVTGNGSDPLVASATWTDPPGTPLPANATSLDDPTPMLVNDLDLRISSAGNDYLPWKLDPGNFTAAATNGDNNVDVVEKIEIAGAIGEHSVFISHKGANLTDGSQDVSIIISNMGTPDFLALTHNGKVYICVGDSNAEFTVNYTPLNGYTGGVSFDAILPGGVSGSFSNPTLSGAGSSTLTLSGLQNLVAGDYNIAISIEGTNMEQELPLILTVLSDDPSDVPVVDLLNPENAQIDVPIVYEFEWDNGGPEVTSYDLQVSRDIDFTNIQFSQSEEFPSSLVLGMQEGYTYWWRVRSNTDCAQGAWSDVFTFTVAGTLGTVNQEVAGLALYPNPASTSFNIRSESPMERIELRNILGQLVMSQNVQNTEAQVSVDRLSNGTYFVRVYRDGMSADLKLIKQ